MALRSDWRAFGSVPVSLHQRCMFPVIWTGLGKVLLRLVSWGLIVCRGGQAGGGRGGPRSNYSDKVTGQARYLPPVYELYQEHVSCSSERRNISTLITRNTAFHSIVMRYVHCTLQQTIKDKQSGKDYIFLLIQYILQFIRTDTMHTSIQCT